LVNSGYSQKTILEGCLDFGNFALKFGCIFASLGIYTSNTFIWEFEPVTQPKYTHG